MAIRADDVDFVRDRELVERYQSGHASAFADLYERYFDRLCRFCERRLGDRHTAEDVAQEAFVRALAAMPRFAGERRFYPWMTVIAHRLCVDRSRDRARVEPAPDVDPGTVDDVHLTTEMRGDVEILDAALGRVRDRHREVLRLREWEGLTSAEIGDRLGLRPATVQVLLHRARRAVQREYAAVGGSRLLAFPFVGAIARSLVRLRPRLPEPNPAWTTALAGSVAATAVGAALVLSGGGSTTAGVSPSVARPVTQRTSIPPPLPADEAPEVATSVEEPAPAVERAEEAAPPPPPPLTPSVGPVSVGFGPRASSEAAEESRQMPVGARAAGAFLGVSPDAVLEGVSELLGGSEPEAEED